MLNTQYINLNMIPSGVMPVLYCSQYDVGRPLGFVVNNGSEVVNLDQYMVAIEGTRSDGIGIVADVNTDGNIGVFLTTATMTNKSDFYGMQLVIRSTDTHRVASIPFMMHVRTAALDENSSVIEEDKSLFQQYTETVMIALAEIRSDVESEATARSNADSALLEKINIEAADRAAEDNALNDRINNIIAPGGAPSAAEVTDARLGADGVLYDTLGEAIRTQFDDVYKNLAYTVNLESDISGLLVVDGGIGGTVPTSLTAKLEPQQTGSGAPSADNIRPFVQFTSLGMLHAGESGGGGSGNPPTMPFWGGTQNCITGEWTLYQYNSNYDGIGDMTDVRWWSDRDVYVPGTNPSVGAYVVYEPTTPMRTSGQPWGAEAMYSGINQYLMTAYDSVTQTRVPFTLNIETDVANVGAVVNKNDQAIETLQSDMDQTNQALTLLRNEYDITASTVTVHTTLIENNTEDIEENTADIAENAQEISLVKSHLGAVEIVDTASGAIASFADGADGVPVRNLTVALEPTQNLHGMPYPYPAGTTANLIPDGTDTANGYVSGAYLSDTGAVVSNDGFYVSEYFPVTGGETYTWSRNEGNPNAPSICFYDVNKTFISGVNAGAALPKTIVAPANAAYARTSQTPQSSGLVLQLEQGSTATTAMYYSNICPVVGHTKVTVMRTGKNLMEVSEATLAKPSNYSGMWTGTTVAGEGAITVTRNLSQGGMGGIVVPFLKAGTYTLFAKAPVTTGQKRIMYGWWADGVFSGQASTNVNPDTVEIRRVITLSKDVTDFFVKMSAGSGNTPIVFSEIALYEGDLPYGTPYEPCNRQSVTIQLGDTIYYGSLDVTNGVLTVEYTKRSLADFSFTRMNGVFRANNNYTLAKNASDGWCNVYNTPGGSIISAPDLSIAFVSRYWDSNNRIAIKDNRFTTVDELRAFLTDVDAYVVTRFTEPTTVQLTAQQISTLLGLNNIWSDAGDVSVDYVADTKLYIEQLTEPDADMVADANITSGQYFMVGNALFLATANIESGGTITPGTNCTRTNLAAALNAINA